LRGFSSTKTKDKNKIKASVFKENQRKLKKMRDFLKK